MKKLDLTKVRLKGVDHIHFHTPEVVLMFHRDKMDDSTSPEVRQAIELGLHFMESAIQSVIEQDMPSAIAFRASALNQISAIDQLLQKQKKSTVVATANKSRGENTREAVMALYQEYLNAGMQERNIASKVAQKLGIHPSTVRRALKNK